MKIDEHLIILALFLCLLVFAISAQADISANEAHVVPLPYVSSI